MIERSLTMAQVPRSAERSDVYHSYCREDLLSHVPPARTNRLLELGAGSGNTLLKAKERGLAATVVGIDSVAMPGSNQQHPAIDRFIIGDVEDERIAFEPGSFDVIICGDVLEHLSDPWKTLARYASYLGGEGLVVASMPNVRYWKVSMALLFGGRWEYRDAGILDRTHLRFFVRRSMMQLFEAAGLTVRSVECLGPQRGVNNLAWALDRLTFGLFTDLLTVQYIIVASRSRQEGC